MLLLNPAYPAALALRISALFNGLWISVQFPTEARSVLVLHVCSYCLNIDQDRLNVA